VQRSVARRRRPVGRVQGFVVPGQRSAGRVQRTTAPGRRTAGVLRRPAVSGEKPLEAYEKPMHREKIPPPVRTERRLVHQQDPLALPRKRLSRLHPFSAKPRASSAPRILDHAVEMLDHAVEPA
jgi:hypothetical protein